MWQVDTFRIASFAVFIYCKIISQTGKKTVLDLIWPTGCMFDTPAPNLSVRVSVNGWWSFYVVLGWTVHLSRVSPCHRPITAGIGFSRPRVCEWVDELEAIVKHFGYVCCCCSRWTRRCCARSSAGMGPWPAWRSCGPAQKRSAAALPTEPLLPSWRGRTQKRPSWRWTVRPNGGEGAGEWWGLPGGGVTGTPQLKTVDSRQPCAPLLSHRQGGHGLRDEAGMGEACSHPTAATLHAGGDPGRTPAPLRAALQRAAQGQTPERLHQAPEFVQRRLRQGELTSLPLSHTHLHASLFLCSMHSSSTF